jgi:hypothetical protein
MDRMLSTSYVASASERERARVVSEVSELLDNDPDLAGERIRIPYRTDVYWTWRR